MRLLFVLPNLGVGGAERATLLIAERLASLGGEVAVVSLGPRVDFDPPKDVQLNVLARRADPLAVRCARLARFLRNWGPDVVFATLWSAIFVTFGAFQLARFQCPLVTVEHNVPSWYSSKVRLGYLKRRVVEAVHRRADSVVTPSQIVQRELLKAGIPGARTHIVPNPVDIPSCVSEPVHDPVTIVCVARLFRHKRVAVVLEAAAALREAHGVDVSVEVFGDGPRRAELENLATRIGLDRQATFHGFVRHVGYAYDRATFVVHVPERESFGNVVVEAMSYARPVVVSPALLESIPWLRPGQNVLLCDGSPAGVARTIAHALSDWDGARAVGAAARQTVLEHASPPSVARRYREVAETVRAGGPARTVGL